ncbi:DUF349 domain-containing protein [Sediminivirga luteola]|uniref:DUF349 domain-containing protein n=1 Tax=Sediminivirga luteola TaxID=1774748 RepID=A0A8J2TYW2_9MICO|nr:DUF349 domain-containing protein [Sediminivirga luteola]MCI2264176.1 DUF349 domain-containing protein [Sediminivirga luteola]GGA17581.1 hypothetical protein GCM10011333_20870 [Sediminivirga luteola]
MDTPSKKPVPKPGPPRPEGRVAVPKPTALRPARPGQAVPVPAAPAAPVQPDGDFPEAAITEAVGFGRAEEDGTVYVRGEEGERRVGQLANATPEEALRYFARKYLELAAAIDVLEQRIAGGAPAADVRKTAKERLQALPEAAVVGDTAALTARLEAIIESTAELEAEQRRRAEEAKAEAKAEREKLVIRAEELAATDPERIQWKNATREMNQLFEDWKAMQASGPRLPRSEDQALWKRFSHARSTLDKHRREFFAKLSERNQEGKRVKEQLIAEAEQLSVSTEWRETAQAYRALMDRWKAAPRAEPKEDDRLWARFRAAQDAFFAARDAYNAELDSAYAENLKVKEQLLAEAESLLPVKDLAAAKQRLRDIQERWEEAGKVPRADVRRVEDGLRRVERAVADAETAEWERTNPEARARANSALAQVDESIAQLEKELQAARDGGDSRKIERAEEALAARRAWREQIEKAASDFS